MYGKFALLALLTAPLAQPVTIGWTNWINITTGAPGSATGMLGSVTVTYSGQVTSGVTNGSAGIWSPNSSFTGGVVDQSPSAVNDAIYLTGIAYNGTNTITFSQAVENPLIAIWSLGQPGLAASFTFNATPTLQAGGPNAQYGGSSITVAGNVVSGQEGNGVVMFQGTFTSLTFTTTPENYYGFTVGLNAPSSPPISGVPEPSSLGLMGLGLLGCAAGFRSRRAAS